MTSARKMLTSAPTSVELEAQLLAEREALERAEVRLAELQIERDAALLADNDAPLADAEQALEACRRQRDRHNARIELLERAHDDAVEAERQAGVEARYERCATQIADGERWLADVYPDLGREIALKVASLREVHLEAERINSFALPAGRARLGFSRYLPAFYDDLSLPSPTRSGANLWPPEG